MVPGARVTDSVSFLQRRGELRGAVRLVRRRVPERFRWRTAVSWVTAKTGGLYGSERFRLEEPVRELVLDLPDRALRREVVLDARRYGVDLDRGEVLPFRTMLDLRRLSYLTETPLLDLQQLVALPSDVVAPIETSATVLGCRALAHEHKRRAHVQMLSLPDPDRHTWRLREQFIAKRASSNDVLSKRWAALANALIDEHY